MILITSLDLYNVEVTASWKLTKSTVDSDHDYLEIKENFTWKGTAFYNISPFDLSFRYAMYYK